MVVLFPMENLVLMKEKKEDKGEEGKRLNRKRDSVIDRCFFSGLFRYHKLNFARYKLCPVCQFDDSVYLWYNMCRFLKEAVE